MSRRGAAESTRRAGMSPEEREYRPRGIPDTRIDLERDSIMANTCVLCGERWQGFGSVCAGCAKWIHEEDERKHKEADMKTDNANRAVDGQRGTPLTKEQKMELIKICVRAWEAQKAHGLCDVDFDSFRHAACWDACRKTGLTKLDQGDFGAAMKYFIRLAGEKPRTATEARVSSQTPEEDDRRRALFALKRECDDQADAFDHGAEGAMTYARGLLGLIHRTTVEQAKAKQIWQVLFTLRSRASARRRKGP